MSIFISWSGPSNRDVGRKVKQFVSEVLGTDDVFMSDEDIAPGDKSLEEIDLALKRSTAALVIVSARTAREPWLNFEAGAMAVRLEKTSVIPILLDLNFSQLIQPLAQFQAIRYDDAEKFRRMLVVLNAQRDAERIKSDTLEIVFRTRWADFQKDVASIIEASASPEDAAELPDERDKIDEILSTLRGMASSSNSAAKSRSGKLSDALAANEVDRKKAPYIHMRVRQLVPIDSFDLHEEATGRTFRGQTSFNSLPDVSCALLKDLAQELAVTIVIETRSVYYTFPISGKVWTAVELD